MELNALGAQYLSQDYVPFSSSSMPVAPGLSPPGSSTFEELLKKTQTQSGRQGDDGEMPISAALKKAPIDKTDKLYELCQELETFLIKNLIKSMRSTVQKTKLIDTGFAGEVYEDMLYDEYAKAFSRNANFGFAEMAYRDLAGLR